MGLLWCGYAYGFQSIDALQYNHEGVPFSPVLEVIDDLRPILWGAAGLLAVVMAGRPAWLRWGVALMGALVVERICYLATQLPAHPLGWFSMMTWGGVYLGVVFANRLPERGVSDESQ